MFTPADLPPPRYRLNSDALLEAMAAIGISKPTRQDLEVGQALAESLMNHKCVSVETLLAVQEVQPPSSLVFKEDGVVTGVGGQLLLRPGAIPALFEDRFDAIDVDLDLLARDGEEIAIGYGWGVAGATPAAREALKLCARVMRFEIYPDLATFTRAVTEAGRRFSIGRQHYRPFRHPEDELLLRLPSLVAEAEAEAERAAQAAATVRELVAA